MTKLFFLHILFILMVSLTGCASHKEVAASEVYTSHNDAVTQRDTISLRDSIHIHDSIFVQQFIQGDTVFQTRYKERTVYRDRWHYENHTDTVQVTDTIQSVYTEYFTQEPTIWQKIRSFLYGVLLSCAVLLFIAFLVYKYKL